MSCDDVRRELELFVTGESARAGEIRAHVASCEACQREHARAVETVALLDRELSTPAPAALADRVLARRRPRWIAWVAAAAVLIGVAFAISRPSKPPPVVRPPVIREVFGPNPQKVRVVDLKRCFDRREVAIVREAESEIEQFAQAQQRIVGAADKRRSDLLDNSHRLVRGTELYEARVKAYRLAELELEMEQRLAALRIQHKRSEVMTRLYNRILAVVREVAREDGIDLALRAAIPGIEEGEEPESLQTQISTRVLLREEGRLEMTGKVIERLNR